MKLYSRLNWNLQMEERTVQEDKLFSCAVFLYAKIRSYNLRLKIRRYNFLQNILALYPARVYNALRGKYLSGVYASAPRGKRKRTGRNNR